MNKTILYKIVLIIIISSLLLTKCEKESGLPVDGDGNEYDTIVIGTQTWLAENLKTTKYNNGVSIPLVTDNNQWISTTTAAFCWYGNNPAIKEDYGALYNWWAVNVSYLCPAGYHVPSREEWNTLISYVGGLAGAKLKDREIRFWLNYDDCKTIDFGFKARPGGCRSNIGGYFGGIREEGEWWSSTNSIYEGWIKGISIQDDNCEIDKDLSIRLNDGASIRCIKNE
jgi:uncharacterized protein (TIGR02145 family)